MGTLFRIQVLRHQIHLGQRRWKASLILGQVLSALKYRQWAGRLLIRLFNRHQTQDPRHLIRSLMLLEGRQMLRRPRDRRRLPIQWQHLLRLIQGQRRQIQWLMLRPHHQMIRWRANNQKAGKIFSRFSL